MFTSAALSLLYLVVALLEQLSSSCQGVSCPCGSTGMNYTFCNINNLTPEEACRTWFKCLQCQDKVHHCLECPAGFVGETCSQSSLKNDLMYCKKPGPIFNGKIALVSSLEQTIHPTNDNTGSSDDDEYLQGTRLQYTCQEAYRLQGNSVITCEDTGFWSAKPPTCVAVCGQVFARVPHLVTGAHYATAGEWPWMVGVAVVGQNSSRMNCGGVLINSKMVLTVASCFWGKAKYQLLFGKFKRTQDNDDKVLERTNMTVTAHPNFKHRILIANIALVQFSPSISFSDRIQPICLPTAKTTAKNIVDGRKGYLTSWGANIELKTLDRLLTSHLSVMTAASCLNVTKTLPPKWSQLVNPNMFCVDYSEVPNEICYGDGGSPMVFYDNVKKRFILEGLVSFKNYTTCRQPGSYTVMTEVLPYVPWILRNMI